MKRQTIAFGAVALAVALSGWENIGMAAQSKTADLHHHVVDVDGVHEGILATFKLALVSPEAAVQKENPCATCYSVVNSGQTLRAFTLYIPGVNQSDKIFIEETQTNKIFEIQGLPFPYRPFSNLVWIDNQILVFDRWSQPHYGIHYAVDFSTKTLLIAAPFPDEFYLDQQAIFAFDEN